MRAVAAHAASHSMVSHAAGIPRRGDCAHSRVPDQRGPDTEANRRSEERAGDGLRVDAGEWEVPEGAFGGGSSKPQRIIVHCGCVWVRACAFPHLDGDWHGHGHGPLCVRDVRLSL